MLLAAILIVLALLGAPLFVIIAACALLGFYRNDVDLTVVAIEFYRLADMSILLAIPLFTFAGYLLSESHAPRRLMRVTQALLGWLPGGLAMVALTACALFTAFTGASGVTIVAMGALLYPALLHAGYDRKFSLGLVTSSGSLGLLFAPSLPLILYGVVAQQLGIGRSFTLDELFLAGVMPGLLMLVLLSAWSFWHNRQLPLTPFSWPEVWQALLEARWELPLPVFLLGGIYSGYFAVSEAAAVTAVYVLIVELLLYRDISWRQLPDIMREAMVMVGSVMVILGVALASTNYMIDADVPGRLFAAVKAHIASQFTFLIALNVFLLILGTMLDIFAALVLVAPLLLPLAVGYDIDPVHLGIIFLANMQIGYITPPVGMNLFIASYRFQQPIWRLFGAALPFFWILLLAVLVITYWPALSLELPAWLKR